MIAYLNGTIQKKLPTALIINAGNIGYLVNISQNYLTECEENDHKELFIHTAVREDDISLYGFEKFEELEVFKLLISVSGVGPKSALEILNNPISSIKYAISNGDSALLVQTKGIGKKTAERIVIDLKEKIGTSEKPQDYTSTASDINEDVVSALENLGYRKHQIIQKLKKMPEEIQEPEDIIKYFLQNA
ncbi:Holliday junction branch migration protein RuvA [Patescibacteria group bacterium]